MPGAIVERTQRKIKKRFCSNNAKASVPVANVSGIVFESIVLLLSFVFYTRQNDFIYSKPGDMITLHAVST
jgi:hypothetical protein